MKTSKMPVLCVLALVALFCLPLQSMAVEGKLVNVNLASTTMPTAANVTGTTAARIFELRDKPGGMSGVFWIDAIAGVTSYGGVSVYFLPAMQNTDLAWANAERIPILINENCVTGATSVGHEFELPPCNYGKIEYELQQTIANQGVTVTIDGHLYFIESPNNIAVPPKRTGPMTTYVMNNLSGVSSLVVPDGTRKVIVSLRGDDVVMTFDGTSPAANNANTLSAGDYLQLTSREQADNFRVRVATGGSGSTLYATPYTK